jgi:hypothetical protein
MNETKICPKCGLPQQWEMWRHCSCGYDFGPGSQATPIRAVSEQQTEPDTEWLTAERLKRFFRYIFIGSLVRVLLTGWIPSLRGLTATAGCIALAFLWVGPTSLFGSEADSTSTDKRE